MNPAFDPYQYILLMSGCLLITLPLEFIFAARVYRRFFKMVQAVAVTVIVFSVWDIIAINAGLWTYSEKFTSGIMLPFNLPFEELFFFIAIPICGLLTYEAVGTVLSFFASRLKKRTLATSEVDDA